MVVETMVGRAGLARDAALEDDLLIAILDNEPLERLAHLAIDDVVFPFVGPRRGRPAHGEKQGRQDGQASGRQGE